MSIQIEKVEIKIGQKIIALTVEDARQLRDVLNDTFPNPYVRTTVVPMPYPVPHYPRWEPIWFGTEGPVKTPVRWSEVTCSGKGTLQLVNTV